MPSQEWNFLHKPSQRDLITSHTQFPLFFFNINLFIYYLFLSELGLRCVQAFSSCSERGLLLVAVRGLLIAVASLVVEHRL